MLSGLGFIFSAQSSESVASLWAVGKFLIVRKFSSKNVKFRADNPHFQKTKEKKIEIWLTHDVHSQIWEELLNTEVYHHCHHYFYK